MDIESYNFKEFKFSDPPVGQIQKTFIASGKPKSGQSLGLLVYLHGNGERTNLRNNDYLIPNVLENNGATAVFVRNKFIVAVPHTFSVRWDSAGLWTSLKSFYKRYLKKKGLSGQVYISGVSMGGTGAWELASEIISDKEKGSFRLKAIAAVDVHKSINDLIDHIGPQIEKLQKVRAMGLRTWHMTHQATEGILKKLDQPKENFIDRHKRKEFGKVWGSLYSSRQFYEWLLHANAPIPDIP